MPSMSPFHVQLTAVCEIEQMLPPASCNREPEWIIETKFAKIGMPAMPLHDEYL